MNIDQKINAIELIKRFISDDETLKERYRIIPTIDLRDAYVSCMTDGDPRLHLFSNHLGSVSFNFDPTSSDVVAIERMPHGGVLSICMATVMSGILCAFTTVDLKPVEMPLRGFKG